MTLSVIFFYFVEEVLEKVFFRIHLSGVIKEIPVNFGIHIPNHYCFVKNKIIIITEISKNPIEGMIVILLKCVKVFLNKSNVW